MIIWNSFSFVPALFSPVLNASPAISSPKEVEVVNLKTSFAAPKVALNKRQLQFAKSYVRKNSEDLMLIKKRSRLPFIIMDSVFSRYGLPVELKYLAVIESELKSSARSRVGALGPWQLMAETAHDWGLKITHRNDERTSFAKSTGAAAKYLKYLYGQFDDWLLVLAAYNSGEGRVCSAIRKSGSRNFWALQYYLPLETRLHVRRFIATHYYFEKQGSTTTLTKAENIEYAKSINAYAAFKMATSSPKNNKVASLTGIPYLNME
ncbi:MAG TPA: lytic transglycosylase domain-containing protein [Puia sp.]|nr:lytic transglycosylase domain-containing protein [Puia sp.]